MIRFTAANAGGSGAGPPLDGCLALVLHTLLPASVGAIQCSQVLRMILCIIGFGCSPRTLVITLRGETAARTS